MRGGEEGCEFALKYRLSRRALVAPAAPLAHSARSYRLYPLGIIAYKRVQYIRPSRPICIPINIDIHIFSNIHYIHYIRSNERHDKY